MLDLGTGDGILPALIRSAWPRVEVVAVDFSPPMLELARARFADDESVTILEHDLDISLPDLGAFDAIVSSFAIHHLVDARKRALDGEVFERLVAGGMFANLDHVSSPTPSLHQAFVEALGRDPGEEDPSNKLVSLEAQLEWMRELGFDDVDCMWKWREFALLVGRKPGPLGT